MIEVHAVRPDAQEVKAGLWDKLYRFLELGPDQFDDPERQKKSVCVFISFIILL